MRMYSLGMMSGRLPSILLPLALDIHRYSCREEGKMAWVVLFVMVLPFWYMWGETTIHRNTTNRDQWPCLVIWIYLKKKSRPIWSFFYLKYHPWDLYLRKTARLACVQFCIISVAVISLLFKKKLISQQYQAPLWPPSVWSFRFFNLFSCPVSLVAHVNILKGGCVAFAGVKCWSPILKYVCV